MKYFFALILYLLACSPQQKPHHPINKFEDAQLIKIYEWQDERNTQALIPFLKAKKEEHRVQAALAFASIQDTLAIPYLAQMLLSDEKELPRRAAALALGQIGSIQAAKALRQAFSYEMSTENKGHILEAIGRCADPISLRFLIQLQITDTLLQKGRAYGLFRALLNNKSNKEGLEKMFDLLKIPESSRESKIIASHFVYRYCRIKNEADTIRIRELIALQEDTEVKRRLELIFDQPEKKQEVFNKDWFEAYRLADNNYEKANMITALEIANDQTLRHFLDTLARNEVLAHILRNAALEKFLELERYYSFYPERMDDLMHYCISSGDMALQSLACLAIIDTTLPMRDYILEHSNVKRWKKRLNAEREKLILPQQMETYIDFSKAIAVLQGTVYKASLPEYNHPIDWEYVKGIPQDQKVRLITSKGEIVLLCFVNEAPSAVSNFLKLVDSGYYDQKYFHRVVPDFVIQAGCPRGDGWGSLNWTQRSEFSNFLHYNAGMVGLASAGKDTEGVQWFITHCSTPHLDGRYSIFAKVISGMEVVAAIVQGDQVIQMIRII